jgi:hypothetical protein
MGIVGRSSTTAPGATKKSEDRGFRANKHRESGFVSGGGGIVMSGIRKGTLAGVWAKDSAPESAAH